MTILGFAKSLASGLMKKPSVQDGAKPYSRNAGNIFFALFAAVGMVGAVGYGFNTVLRGPISAMNETTRRTVAESTLITSSRMAVVGATTQQSGAGDTDADGMIEPVPYRDAGASPHPVGGGWIPAALNIPSTIDPWSTEYGYCAWDHGSITASSRRLAGSPNNNRFAIAIISAGKDKRFQTSCVAYVDDTTELIQKTPGSDDIVLAYTYAEANNIGNGLWKPSAANPATAAAIDKGLEVRGGGTFSGGVTLGGNQTTGGGLILPQDPGDNSLTGACDGVNDKQLRYNIGDGSAAPVIEICDNGGLGWTPVSGGAGGGGGGGGGGTTGQLVAHYKFDETAGTTAHDTTGNHDGTLYNNPAWAPGQGKVGGALKFTAANDTYVRVPRTTALEPSAITFSAWVKRDGAQENPAGIVTKVHNTSNYVSWNMEIDFNGNDSLIEYFIGTTGGISPPLANTTNLLASGAWMHVTAVYDPAGAAPQMRFYVNGALSESFNDTTPIEYGPAAEDLFIGSNSSGGEFFNGYIDDVRIYNYGMTGEQVSELYNSVNTTTIDLTNPAKPGTLFSWGNDLNERLGNGTQSNKTSPYPVVNGSGFVQVSGGSSHACGVKSDGTAWCWGNDASGQLGNGAGVTSNQSAPYQVTGLANIIKISAGTAHSCALQNNGNVWCWGTGAAVGGANTPSPAQVLISNVIDISAGNNISCAVTNDGAGWCWGVGNLGELGNGTTGTSSTPVRVSNVSDFVSIFAGVDTTAVCGVTKRGIGYCWGSDSSGRLGNGAVSTNQNTPSEIDTPEDFVKIEVSGTNGCGLRASGKVSCWGSGGLGQLGNGTTPASVDAPVEVSNVEPFIDLAVGGQTNCAASASGSVWCWGTDTNGVLGDGELNSSNVSRPVLAKIGNAYKIAAGGLTQAMYVLSDTAAVTTTGLDDFNRKFSVAASESDSLHACHIRTDGTVWCWGVEAAGELGNGGGATDTAASPVAVTDPGPWFQVSSGADHTCGIKVDGSAWCWGSDGSGQLGNGATAGNQVSPSPVTNPDTIPWTQISTGYASTCAIKADGSLWCWGSDTNGALGNGAGGNATQPTAAITSTIPWTMVSQGYEGGCGIKRDSTLWCWGAATNGRLGNGTTTPAVQSPVQVGTDKWSYVVSKSAISCGIKIDGSLWCWGYDENGKLGNGSVLTADQTTPSLVLEPGPWKSVSTGNYNTCATKMDGTGWCWGQTSDRLGYGGTNPGSDVAYPRPVVGKDWALIDGGGTTHRCGIKTDSSVWCWGNDFLELLGNGAGNASSNYPQKIYQPYKSTFTAAETSQAFSAATPTANMAIGTTYLTDTEGSARGLSFPGSGRSLLYQNASANQLYLSSGATVGGPSQLWLTANGLSYYMGYGSYSGNLEFGNSSDWLTNVTAPSLDIANTGFVGVGTGGAPVAKLDIRGAVKMGDAGSTCNGSTAGTIKYADGAHTYCNGATWVDFGYTPSPAGLPWETMPLAVRGGNTHTCAITANGALWCWGDNSQGKLGNNSTTQQTTPVLVNTGPWLQAGTGNDFSCALRYDRTAWCWGDNGYGQLGNNNGTTDSLVPVQVIGGSVWQQISVGYNHACGVKTDGTLWCWGSGSFGQRGDGSTSANQGTPVEVNGSAQWKFVSAGTTHTCAIRVNGVLMCWGAAANGRLGNGTTTPNTSTPVQAGLDRWMDVTTGNDFSCGLKTDGTAWCWGRGNSGRLGNGSTSDSVLIVAVSGGGTWRRLSAGDGTTCGIKSNGTAWCWGIGSAGQLGDGTTTSQQTTPIAVSGGATWESIGTGAIHVCGTKPGGTLWCWGAAANGRLGNGTTTPNLTTPVQMP